MKKNLLGFIMAVMCLFASQQSMAQCGGMGFASATVCQSNPMTIHGQVTTATGTYYDTISISAGCDSFTTWQVSVINNVYNNTYDTICSGDTVTWIGRKLFATGSYYDTLFTGPQNCDSILAFYLYVGTGGHPTDTVHHTFCRTFGPGSYYDFYGQHLTQAGTYHANVPATHGCDTARTLILAVVNGGFPTNINASICASGSYNFNGRILTTAGNYADTLHSVVTGCDSIIRLTLTISNYVSAAVRDSFCAGTTYTFKGHTYTTQSPGGGPGGGGYKDTVTGVAGCDTIFTLTLRYKVAPNITVRDSFCQGTYYHYGADSFNTQGNHTAFIPTTGGGCDTTVTLILRYKVGPPVPTITRAGNILVANTTGTGTYTYQWYLNGSPIATATAQAWTAASNGSYTVAISSGVGCTATSAAYVLANLGIGDISNDMFKLYPNPNTGKFTLEVQQYAGMEAIVYDVLGRTIAQKQLAADKEIIDISTAPNGTYSLILRNNDGVKTAHFVIAR